MFSDPENPCPEHPGWGVHECVWCHPERRQRVAYFRGITMHQKEREEIFRKTGLRVDSRDGLEEKMAAKGLREMDSGESYCNGGESFDPFGDYARAKPLNTEERFEHHVQRLEAGAFKDETEKKSVEEGNYLTNPGSTDTLPPSKGPTFIKGS